MNKAERTKQFIVEKTAPIFNRKGYAGTSLSDMTEATGLTKGSIYGNFANKDEVALTVFDYNLKKIDSIVKGEMSKQQSVKDQLLVYVNVYNNFQNFPFPEGGCPILNTATEADDTHQVLKKKAADAINSWKNKIISLVEKGLNNKEFSKPVNAEQFALTFIAVIEGGIMITNLTGKINYRKSIMQSLEKMIRELE